MRKAIAGLGLIGALLISPLARAATIQANSSTFFTDVTSPYNQGTCPKAANDDPLTLADGTAAKPWPACAIKAAVAAATGGDTVLVNSGYWRVSTALTATNANGNLTIQGQSTNAKLMFTPSGVFSIGSQSSYTHNVTISGLTIDASQITGTTPPFNIYNCANCSFTANVVIGTSNNSLPAVLFSGGLNTKVSGNTIVSSNSSPGGGAQLQINELSVSSMLPNNTGYEVFGNYFDSVNLLVIGQSNIRIHHNTFVNKLIPTSFAIFVAPSYGGLYGTANGPIHNVQIDHNTLDALANSSPNSATISGMPQDVGGQGAIEGFSIVDNVIRGTVASINLSAYVPAWLTAPNISKTYDAVISNNSLYSIWTNSVIDLSGGTYGLVQTVSVQGNSVLGAGTGVIQSDAHTSAVNSANNAL